MIPFVVMSTIMQMDFVKHVVHIRRPKQVGRDIMRIYNAGQLFWFAKQFNDGKIPNKSNLEADEGY